MKGIEIRGPSGDRYDEVLSDEAQEFVAGLQREFGGPREQLLERRADFQARLNAGENPDFWSSTRAVREGDWKVAPVPDDLADRKVEITGPTDRKMMINAFNSGASTYMADFEDANAPTWANMVTGQVNLVDAIERKIDFESPDGKRYELNDEIATLIVRPRGWHLVERHMMVDGKPVSGSLFDFGVFMFNCAQRLVDRGSGPYFYLPKLESPYEARLWNDAFVYAQEKLGLDRGTIKATVLVETILAAFVMDEILYELKDHSAGLNAGRWDYIFSIIKKFRSRPGFVLPDRNEVSMTVPFMRSYTELLVKTCHHRGAHAVGGMAAFIPSRKDPKINETAIAKVTEDKEREAGDGFDGTWVAHPDLVPVAKEVFDRVLGDRTNQLEVMRVEVSVTAAELLDFSVPGKGVTEQGVRSNVSVALLYVESWLRGVGAAALFNLMEDAATAEIARSQIWQWIRAGAKLEDGTTVDREFVEGVEEEEMDKIAELLGSEAFDSGRFKEAEAIFERVCLEEHFEEFLTIPAYEYLD